jgi:hypothetical protein
MLNDDGGGGGSGDGDGDRKELIQNTKKKAYGLRINTGLTQKLV